MTVEAVAWRRHTTGERAEARRQHWQLLVAALIAGDALLLVSAVVIAGQIRAQFDSTVPIGGATPSYPLMVSLVGLATVLLLFHITGLYDVDQILEGSREYARVAHATTYGLVLVLAATFLAGSSQWVSRSWLLL